MTPTEHRSLTNRAMNEALSQLAVAGVEPPEAVRQMAREIAAQLRAYEGGAGAAERLYLLADEMAVTR